MTGTNGSGDAEGRPGRYVDPDSLRPPPWWLLACEGRAWYELSALVLARPFLRFPQGDGHPVLVFPGFVASGVSTRPLRAFLRRLGYEALCWEQGRNLGLHDGLEERLRERVREVRRASGRKVSLIGWSLGGVFAREVARQIPEEVRLVITMGSPFGAPRANHSWRLYELLAGTRIRDVDPARLETMATPPPVPSTSIYSETDGVVAWQCCLERPGPHSESVAVRGSHLGLGFNPLVYEVVADRLAQPEGRWSPFRRSGLRRHFYRRPRYPRPSTA